MLNKSLVEPLSRLWLAVEIPGSAVYSARTVLILLVVGCALSLARCEVPKYPALTNYVSSWIGNTFPGTPCYVPTYGSSMNGRHGTCYISGIYATPNGKIVCTSFADEGERPAPIYDTEGRSLGQLAIHDNNNGFDGGAVTADDKYAWATMHPNPGPQPGIVCRFDMATGVYSEQRAKLSAETIHGLAVNSAANELYVSDTVGNTIKVVAADTLTPLRSWPVSNPGRLALDAVGNVWVLQYGADANALTPPSVNTTQMKAFCYANTGTLLKTLIFPDDVVPHDIAINPTNGRLVVADAGAHSQLRIYNVDGNPTLESTFGTDGGIVSGVKGQVAPLKFNHPDAVTVDQHGNLYVGCNGGGMGGFTATGTEVQSYSADGVLRWSVYGLEYVACASIDPEDETSIYSPKARYTMDYTKPLGQESTYSGLTLDLTNIPHDPRSKGVNGTAQILNIAGHKLMAMCDTMGGVVFYRIDHARNGEILVPSAMISVGTGRDGNNDVFPPHQPARGGWIWRDVNGNHDFDADEYTPTEGYDNSFAWLLDANGTVYHASGKKIVVWPLQGFDVIGNPIYTDASRTVMPVPATLPDIRRMAYDVPNDTMYLAGFSDDYPGNNWQGFRVLRAYKHWSDGNRTPAWTIEFPYERKKDGLDLPKGFCIAGDYLFWVMLGAYESTESAGTVYVNRLSDGAAVGHLKPSYPVGFCGWCDIDCPVTAYQRANGEYLILHEEDWNQKNVLIRWGGDTAMQTLTFTPAPSSFVSPCSVTLQCATPGAIIRYTTDGSEPTNTSALYTVPLTLTNTTTVKARAFKNGMPASYTASGEFTKSHSYGVFTHDMAIGDPLMPTGEADEVNGTYTISGSGIGIGGQSDQTKNRDQCHFLYRLLSGDGSITARLVSLTEADNKFGVSAGVMIRATRDGNSPFAALLASPITSGGSFAARPAVNAPCIMQGGSIGGSSEWLRLTRTGDIFTGEYSTDGVHWHAFPNTVTVPMSGPVAIGLCVTSCNAGILTTSTFADVSVSGNYLVTAPTFSPGSGTYYSPQRVTMGCTTAGANIRYTIDGSLPTGTTGILYTAPLTLNNTKTLRAIAFVKEQGSSRVADGDFVISHQCALPRFDAPAGTYNIPQMVTLLTTTPGATVRYTTDGSTPSMQVGTSYTGPVPMSNVRITLKAIAYANGLTSSPVARGDYVLQSVTPTCTPGSGSYPTTQRVSMSTPTPGAIIYYTLDGTEPTAAKGLRYSGPLLINQARTRLKAIAIAPGYVNSSVVNSVYTIQCVQPTFSMAAGIYTSLPPLVLSTKTDGATIRYTTDGSTPSTSNGTVYTHPIAISNSMTLQAVTCKNGMTPSAVASDTYTLLPATTSLMTPALSAPQWTIKSGVCDIKTTDGNPTPCLSVENRGGQGWLERNLVTPLGPVPATGITHAWSMEFDVRCASADGWPYKRTRGFVYVKDGDTNLVAIDLCCWDWSDDSVYVDINGTHVLTGTKADHLQTVYPVITSWQHVSITADAKHLIVRYGQYPPVIIVSPPDWNLPHSVVVACYQEIVQNTLLKNLKFSYR